MTNFEFACHIAAVKWTEDERQLVSNTLQTTNNNELISLIDYLIQWKIGPMAYIQLNKHGLLTQLPDELQLRLKEEHDKVSAQNSKRNAAAKVVLKKFIAAGIDVIVLKGNYLAHEVYQDIGYKRMNDFDILIHLKDWDRIQDIYLELGYIPLGFGWSGEKEKPAKFSHVGMSFISPDLSCIMGSQWGLKSPTAGYSVNIEKAWDTAREFHFLDVPLKALTPEYNLLHLILHLGVYKCGIRDCMDLFNIFRTTEVDASKLNEIVRESVATDKAIFALSITQLCSSAVEDHYLTSLGARRNGFLKKRLSNRLQLHKETGDFQLSYNDYFQDIEKQVIYFNLFPKFHQKLRYYLKILRLVYFPKKTVLLKLTDNVHRPSRWNVFVGWLKAPYLVFSLIAQEIGWTFAILLFIKLFFDLIVSIKNYFIRTTSYFDYLHQKGIDPAKIEAVVKNIQ